MQTENILFERNIYLIRIFQKYSFLSGFFLNKLVIYDSRTCELLKIRNISILFLFGLILLPFIGEKTFAESDQFLTITTEKEFYSAGETIDISGVAETKLSDFKVTIRIFNPINNLITIDEFEVNTDGTFSGKIPTSIDGLWQKDGTYTIIANYYSSDQVETQFEYGGMISAGVLSEKNDGDVQETKIEDYAQSLDLEEYQLGYELTGAEIIQMFPDVEMNSLIIKIKTYSDGELRVTIPKDVIDTDEHGFFVLVDGEEKKHEAISNLKNWNFVIPFSYGSEEIEIIGTYVIPEFGIFTVSVLIIAIGVIIVFSMKNKTIFYQKI